MGMVFRKEVIMESPSMAKTHKRLKPSKSRSYFDNGRVSLNISKREQEQNSKLYKGSNAYAKQGFAILEQSIEIVDKNQANQKPNPNTNRSYTAKPINFINHERQLSYKDTS